MGMEVKIEKLIYGGEGLAHHEGHTVFVPFVLPNEVVAVEPVESKKKFVRGRVERLLTPSAERTAAPCPHFGVCGGCHYQHIPYEAQVQYKIEILRETLGRIGHIRWDGAIEAHTASPFQYRNRAQWKIRPASGRTPPAAGYLRAGSSELCPVTECPIISPRLAKVFAALRQLLSQEKMSATLAEMEVFVDAADEKTLVSSSVEEFNQATPRLLDTLRSSLPGVETVLLLDPRGEHMELSGPGFLTYDVGGFRYRVGHLSFFQVNRYLIPELMDTLLEQEKGDLALDVYAGVGLFTLPLARRFSTVVGVESDPAAARDLHANIVANRLAARRVHSLAETFLASWKQTPDFVILDPPRAGVTRQALVQLRQLAPKRIAYLSCDPSTLARDLELLTSDNGRYEITDLHLFDLFPQTYHIESLARLRLRC